MCVRERGEVRGDERECVSVCERGECVCVHACVRER